MSTTAETCRRLKELGVCDATEALAMALRAQKVSEAVVSSGNYAQEKEGDVALMARWRYNAAVRGEIKRYRSRSQSPPPPSLSGDDEEFFRAHAKHLPSCPDCKGKNLEPAALQTRSADEGPSIYMKCKACNKIVRPVYKMKGVVE